MKTAEILKRIRLDAPEGLISNLVDVEKLAELIEEITEKSFADGWNEATETLNASKEEILYNTLMESWNNAPSAKSVGINNPRNIYSNKLLPQSRRFTPQIKKALGKLMKDKYTEEDFVVGITNYIKDIIGRNPDHDYSKHRFSFLQFIKQENGFVAFYDKI